ncbi:MAG: hypothetical protein LUE63_09075 [Lachnospiraceae bacterium]|nr:hypothetical protein [Lachnospiraceae bacterium]
MNSNKNIKLQSRRCFHLEEREGAGGLFYVQGQVNSLIYAICPRAENGKGRPLLNMSREGLIVACRIGQCLRLCRSKQESGRIKEETQKKKITGKK